MELTAKNRERIARLALEAREWLPYAADERRAEWVADHYLESAGDCDRERVRALALTLLTPVSKTLVRPPAPWLDAGYGEGWSSGEPEPAYDDVGGAAEPPDVVAAYPGYQSLEDVLWAALEQSAAGKGKERHANDDLPFDDQPIMEITRDVGLGFPVGQARKKIGEAFGMVERAELDAARREMLGAIVYIAAAVLRLEEQGAQ